MGNFKRGDIVKIINYYFDVPEERIGMYITSSMGSTEYWGNKIISEMYHIFCFSEQAIWKIPDEDLHCIVRVIEEESAFNETTGSG